MLWLMTDVGHCPRAILKRNLIKQKTNKTKTQNKTQQHQTKPNKTKKLTYKPQTKEEKPTTIPYNGGLWVGCPFLLRSYPAPSTSGPAPHFGLPDVTGTG